MCITWDLTKKEEIEKRMRHFKTSMTKLIKQSKAKHLNKLFLGNMLILFKIWQGICKIININKTKSNETNCIQVNNKTRNDSSKTANEFNKYFSSMTKKVEEKLIKPKSNFSQYLNKPYQQSLFINATSLFINATESSENIVS